MSLPALRAVRSKFPDAHIAVLALPWVSDLYARERWPDRVIPYRAPRGARGWIAKWAAARELQAESYDTALILPNSFDSALTPWLARIPRRIGFARDARKWLLTDPIRPVLRGSIPSHESYYYLELLRRAGWIGQLPPDVMIRLEGAAEARAEGLADFGRWQLAAPLIGISPGAAYGTAKRWLPERFAKAAIRLSQPGTGSVALFGTASERELCEQVRRAIETAGVHAVNLAGATSLREFIQLAAACRVFLTNDSGSMHIASALNVPTVAIFGATDHIGTGPTGDRARVVREHVDCSPCLLRNCPIDHRCMTAVTADRVALTALELLK
ncbi:MAG: lipopolysaccharide heptosyltransferase II [Bryobacterales bacterium]|nr:lipopolysaccharide heptosyltransferase II [Bryobacterales bacterium]